MPKLNSHKSNNHPSQRSIQVPFSLFLLFLTPCKSNFLQVEAIHLVPMDLTYAELIVHFKYMYSMNVGYTIIISQAFMHYDNLLNVPHLNLLKPHYFYLIIFSLVCVLGVTPWYPSTFPSAWCVRLTYPRSWYHRLQSNSG